MLEKAAGDTSVRILQMHTKYPQGSEKQTIKAALDRDVPDGGLPLDIGVVVVNVGTCAALARTVVRGGALTHRIISVTGPGVARPKNVLTPLGVSVDELLGFCGGLTPDAARVICGGPMMGQAIGDLKTPVTKTTSGITVLTEDDVKRAAETNCVRCGRCVDVCPLKLVPTRLGLASREGIWDIAKKYSITSCMECGCCAYVCPASLPLVQLIRQGKALMPRD
jgi:electron transport complex protein RnfC